MASGENLNPESGTFYQSSSRPSFVIGRHESDRELAITDELYTQILHSGFHFVTAPITNEHFHQRVIDLYQSHLVERETWTHERGLTADQAANQSLPVPIVPTLTDKDTSFIPSNHVGSLVANASPWIDLCSPDPIISSISRQVLNIETAYANFCGARSIVIPGPRSDDSARGIAQYARAVQEAHNTASKSNIIIHMPMYREPGLDETCETLSSRRSQANGLAKNASSTQEIDLFSAWDSWHTIRSVCKYASWLFVAIRVPRRLPEKALQDRWFAEPLHYLTIGRDTFQSNKTGHPSLTRHHQEMINSYMRLKNSPWMILCDVGPDTEALMGFTPRDSQSAEFPTLGESAQALKENRKPHMPPMNAHVGYMKYLERQQPPYSAMETLPLTNFQDWLQSPLQPLSDNLESATYEVFESDPVKYDQYEHAIAEAMSEWRQLGKPTSSVVCEAGPEPELIVAVAGAGRGPLVTRVLRAAETTKTKIQLWALEKNQNALVYLLRQNERAWGGRVTVVKTDMRGWEGPRPKGSADTITKVDILVSELLGSFGDNELSPECLDGIQRHIARPHGISIPHSYTAHLSPIATPRIYADLSSRVIGDPNAFETPWVTRLYAINFAAQNGVPGHPRFQQAWEFVHPVEVSRADDFAAEHGLAKKFVTSGGGSITGSAGTNEHNARHCHLTFVCRSRGVIHGLAGYFESTLYAPQVPGKDLVEISILPDQIDRKSKDMISWFPIFFPIKEPLYFPQDSELEVSMWRQTDDTKVWYEWMVEAFAWVGPNTRVKIGASEMHSSRKIACLM